MSSAANDPNVHKISPFFHNRYDPNDKIPVFSRVSFKGDPREQSVIHFLYETLCPTFSFFSFSFVIIVLNFIAFIVTLCINGLEGGNKIYNLFLPVNQNTFKDIDLQGYALRNNPGHVYRWFVHDFLHSSFEHIFSNCFGILIIGTLLEYFVGTLRYILIYFLSGLLGSLFSVLVDPEAKSVGASICCYGIVAALLGFDFINWQVLPEIYGMHSRCSIVCFPIIMLFAIFPIFDVQDNVNVWGHLGGAIFGFLISLFIITPQDNAHSCGCFYRIYLIVGVVCTVVLTIIGLLLFYLLNYYKGE